MSPFCFCNLTCKTGKGTLISSRFKSMSKKISHIVLSIFNVFSLDWRFLWSPHMLPKCIRKVRWNANKRGQAYFCTSKVQKYREVRWNTNKYMIVLIVPSNLFGKKNPIWTINYKRLLLSLRLVWITRESRSFDKRIFWSVNNQLADCLCIYFWLSLIFTLK